jgi:hypothetical protein
MARAYASIILKVPVETVWSLVRDFNGLPQVGSGSRPGVVRLPTNAWYDPVDPAEDKPIGVHGNPSVLRRDAGTLAQGCTGQLAVVQVGTFNGNLPPTPAFDPPGKRNGDEGRERPASG